MNLNQIGIIIFAAVVAALAAFVVLKLTGLGEPSPISGGIAGAVGAAIAIYFSKKNTEKTAVGH